MYVHVYVYRAAMVYRVPNRPTEQAIPLSPPSYSWPPFHPRKLIKVQLIKITYFSSIGAEWERTVVEGDRRRGRGEGSRGMYAACARLRSFFFVFCGVSSPALLPPPAFSRLPSFPSFFCFLQYQASEAGFLAI